MIRKSISVVILLSLALHCACRVGFLSYLYKQRHEVAYFLNLIDEIPIAECSSSYYTDSKGLTINVSENSGAVPIALTTVSEIILFVKTTKTVGTYNLSVVLQNLHATHPAEIGYHSPDLDIFQPPRM